MLQVGFATGDITPEIGMNMPGGFLKNPGKGVRDRLLAVACVITDGTKTIALVGFDALFAPRDLVDPARRIILKETKIDPDHVLIGSNHTHTGGPLWRGFGQDEDAKYTEKTAKAIAGAVKSAWSSLHASEIGVGTGHEAGISFNRRFLMRDGREITHPGKPGTPHHKDIVCPAGPIDPDVGVLAVRAPGGELRGVVVHFACHSTVVGGNRFSPDYAGYLRKHLRAHYGATTPVCFLLGPCGDITQVDNMATSVDFGPECADMMGQKLAGETIRTIRRMTWHKSAEVNAVVEKVPVSIRPEPDVKRETPPFGLGSDGPKGVHAKRFEDERKHVADLRKKTPTITAEVQGVRVGPLGIATNGAEYFCEYGLRIKKASRHPFTWVSTLSNDYIGYVPTPQAFAGGGYEPRTARSSMLSPDAGQRLLEGALKALNRLLPKADEKKEEKKDEKK
jgi:neutral ceramidase